MQKNILWNINNLLSSSSVFDFLANYNTEEKIKLTNQ